MENQQEQQQNLGKEFKKEEDRFKRNLAKLGVVVGKQTGGSTKLALPKKVPASKLGDLVDELFEDERKQKIIDTKNKLKETLTEFGKYSQNLKEQELTLAKFKLEQQKNFNKKIEGLLNSIEEDDELKKLYTAAMGGAMTGEEVREEEPKNEE